MLQNHVKTVLRLLCALFICILLGYSVKWGTRITHGFTAYYVSAKMILQGDDFATSYNNQTFLSKIKEYGISNVRDVPRNLPSNALVFLPIAWLSPVNAKIAWTGISLLCFFAGVYALFKGNDIQWRSNTGLSMLSLLLLFKPLYMNIALGQIYIFLFCIFSLAAYAFKKQHIASGASIISSALMLKGYGVVAYSFSLLTNRSLKAWSSLLLLPAIFLCTLPMVHLQSWSAYYDTLSTTIGRMAEDSHVAYQTINGLIRHLFLFDVVWSPFPVFQLSDSVVNGISVSLNLIVMIIVMIYSIKLSKENFALSFFACVAVNVVTAPIAEEYHYVLFLPLFVGLFVQTIFKRESLKQISIPDILLIIAFFFMAIPIRYTSLQSTSFPIYLLAYPKLYAGMITLGMFVLHAKRTTFIDNKKIV